MTLADTLAVRQQARCPVCRALHCLTAGARLWTHGKRGARCRGSRLTLAGARVAARDIRGVRTLHLPEEAK